MSDEPRWSSWPAPAKLNLFLRIPGRRADGYHLLQTVFRLLEWGDEIRLRPRQDGQILRHGDLPAGLDRAADLAVRAAILLAKDANCAQGADIFIEKRIPAGAGFGGGSSDAATVLLALDLLWGTHLGLERLAALGLHLGADVPVFVRGDNAWAEGIGELLTPIALPPAWYLLVDPGVHAATAGLFQAPELTRDAAPATIVDFVSDAAGRHFPLGNAFEPVLRRREPAVEAAFVALAAVGRPQLTGSGSGCFVEFGDLASAQAALAVLQQGLLKPDVRSPGLQRAWIAAGANRSPLHAALDAFRLQGRRQEAQGTRF
ncbi:MAG: 4-(cytidine 5'-diphospho)-2-C-methyl-D-erythritol kinase [Luteimonas sp.]